MERMLISPVTTEDDHRMIETCLNCLLKNVVLFLKCISSLLVLRPLKYSSTEPSVMSFSEQ